MMKGIFTLVFCLVASFVFGQLQYRTRANTAWATRSTWEVFITGTGLWTNLQLATPASTYPIPSAASGTITIRNPISIGSNVTADEIVFSTNAPAVGGLTINSNSTLTLANGSGNDMVLIAGTSLSVTGTLILNAGSVLSAPASANITVGGEVDNAGTITNVNAIAFNQGSIYKHQSTSSIPTGTWDPQSNCVINANLTTAPGGLGQNFGNFEWDTSVLSNNINLNGALTNVVGSLTFTNTGGFTVSLNGGGSLGLTIGGSLSVVSPSDVSFTGAGDVDIDVAGDFIFDGNSCVSSTGAGDVNLNVTGGVGFLSGSFNAGSSTGATTISLGGDYVHDAAGTTLSNTGGQPLTIDFNGSGFQNYLATYVPTIPVNYKTSNTANLVLDNGYALAGPGTLDVGSGSFVSLLSTNPTGALLNGAVGGNIQNTGTRTYAGSVVYASSAHQYMSSQQPGDANTIINNAANVELVGNVTYTTGMITLGGGLLQVKNRTLTLEHLTPAGGFISVDPASSIVINGGQAFGDLDLVMTGASMNNLTINRTNALGRVRQVTPGLNIAGTLTLLDGVFELAAGTTTTVSGPLSVGNVSGSGAIQGDATSNLIIAPAGTMTTFNPSGLFVFGSLNTFTLNRTGTLNFFTTNLAVTNLNLLSGTLNNTSATFPLTMANGGLVTRTNGFFTGIPTVAGTGNTFDVYYGDFTAATITSGAEIPTGPFLNDFTLNNSLTLPKSLTMGTAIDAADDINITRGTLVTAGLNISLGGDLTVTTNGNMTTTTSRITFDGGAAQVFSSVPTLTLNQLWIDQTPASTLTLSGAGMLNVTSLINVNTASTFATANKLTLVSTASATGFIGAMPGGANVTGNVIVQRYLPNAAGGKLYRYIASPAASTVSDWQAEFPITGPFANPSTGAGIVSGTASLFYYNEALVTGSTALNVGYVGYPPSGVNSSNPTLAAITPGVGYSAYMRPTTPFTYDTRGVVGQHNVDVNVTHSGGVNGGWNLIGNPYPASVDWRLVGHSGIDNAIYMTDNAHNSGQANVSWVNNVASPIGYVPILAQGQAFFVKVTNPGTGQVNFQEVDKPLTQPSFIRQGEPSNLLRVVMKNGSKQDDIAVYLEDEASSDFDSRFDAYKFGAEGLNISSLTKNNDRLSINGIARGSCDNTVPLFIDGGANGNYSLDFTGMSTFDPEITVYLDDKVEHKRISVASSSHYDFSVTDAVKLKDRFALVFDGPSIETTLAVKGEITCADNTFAQITLENSQANVKYSASVKGTTVSSEFEGNGGQLSIPVSVDLLPQGEQEITISARMSGCDALPLANKAKLTVFGKGVISKVEDGTSCSDGSADLKVTGTNAVLYNWYEDEGDAIPIANQHADVFNTPVLAKSKTYYVAAVNGAGCEGARMPVKATIVNLDQPMITAEGNVLTSSIAEGIQWYLDGLPIENATGKSFEAIISGVYTVKATQGKCSSTSEGREMVVTATEESASSFINIFPNPTTDKVTVEVKSNKAVEARLIHASGKEVSSIKLVGENVKSGEFTMASLPDGVYLLRIHEGHKVFTKKISKIK